MAVINQTTSNLRGFSSTGLLVLVVEKYRNDLNCKELVYVSNVLVRYWKLFTKLPFYSNFRSYAVTTMILIQLYHELIMI